MLSIMALSGSLLSYRPAVGIVGDPRPADTSFARHAVMLAGNRGRCSGAVLTQNLVLTAAHCVLRSSSVGIVSQGVGSTATKIVIHPEFKIGQRVGSETAQADLALVKFSQPLPNDYSSVFFAALPVRAGDHLFVVGYGRALETAIDSGGIARMIELVVRTHTPRRMVLSDLTGRGGGSCIGDSGGPVFADGPDRHWLVGIVQGRVPGFEGRLRCGDDTIVTPIAPYRGWIVETASKLRSPLQAGE